MTDPWGWDKTQPILSIGLCRSWSFRRKSSEISREMLAFACTQFPCTLETAIYKFNRFWSQVLSALHFWFLVCFLQSPPQDHCFRRLVKLNMSTLCFYASSTMKKLNSINKDLPPQSSCPTVIRASYHTKKQISKHK